jgi:glycosyltransferase involved in cell wall biosynthesis
MGSPIPLVTVVIPSRDRPELLGRAIQSVIEQTYRAWELVVIDDASTQPLEPLIASVPRIRVIRNEVAVGPARARNQGADQSKGELIAFLDDDDKYMPRKLESAVRCLTRYPSANAVHHPVAFAHTKGMKSTADCQLSIDPVKRMLLRQPPHPSGIVVRSSVHARIRFDESFKAAADLDYCLRLALDGPTVELSEVLAAHGEESSRSSLIALDQRIIAREQFRTKHEALFRDPSVAAFHHTRLAHLYRRSNQRASALKQIGIALRLRPTFMGAYRALVLTMLPKSILRIVFNVRI